MLPYDAVAPYTFVTFTLGTEVKSSGGGGGGMSGGGEETVADIEDKETKQGAINAHTPYITGIDATHVGPDAHMTREQAAAVIYRILGEPSAQYAETYPDVDAARWSATAIAHMRSSGIMTGLPEGIFNPSGDITRAEFATILVRLKEYPQAETNKFPDAQSHWAKGYIGAASEYGLVDGYPDGTFRPDAPITRAEVITAVNRMLGHFPDSAAIAKLTNPYVDLPRSHWAYKQIMEAVTPHTATVEDGVETWNTEGA
jgi:hypothetical protein